MAEIPLERLATSAQNGDTEAFRALFEHLNDRVFRYAASHVGDREAALDIVQDMFVELWGALKRFRWQSDEAFYGFVFIILKRRIARHHADTTKRKDLPDDIDTAYMMESEDYRHLMKCLDSLSGQYRDVLMLRYWSDLTYGEIAHILDSKEATVKVWHHRAIEELKLLVKKHEYA